MDVEEKKQKSTTEGEDKAKAKKKQEEEEEAALRAQIQAESEAARKAVEEKKTTEKLFIPTPFQRHSNSTSTLFILQAVRRIALALSWMTPH